MDTADNLTLRALIDLYCRHKLAMASPSSVYKYRQAFGFFREYLGREPMLTDLRDDTVTAVCGWILRTKRLSPATASKFRDCICAAWRLGSRKRIEGIAGEPDIPEIREPRRIPVAWTRQELAQLWDYLHRLPGDVGGIKASDWFCSLHAVLWDAGSRIGEAMQSEWQHVDLAGGWVVMRAETRKGGLSDKLAKLHPSTVELLERIQYPQRRLVWPWPWNKFYLWRVYGDIIKRAGLPGGRQRKFHCLRKSCASHISALGGNAQEAMGHATGQMTRDYYLDPKITRPQFPSDILFRPDDDMGSGSVTSPASSVVRCQP